MLQREAPLSQSLTVAGLFNFRRAVKVSCYIFRLDKRYGTSIQKNKEKKKTKNNFVIVNYSSWIKQALKSKPEHFRMMQTSSRTDLLTRRRFRSLKIF